MVVRWVNERNKSKRTWGQREEWELGELVNENVLMRAWKYWKEINNVKGHENEEWEVVKKKKESVEQSEKNDVLKKKDVHS